MTDNRLASSSRYYSMLTQKVCRDVQNNLDRQYDEALSDEATLSATHWIPRSARHSGILPPLRLTRFLSGLWTADQAAKDTNEIRNGGERDDHSPVYHETS